MDRELCLPPPLLEDIALFHGGFYRPLKVAYKTPADQTIVCSSQKGREVLHFRLIAASGGRHFSALKKTGERSVTATSRFIRCLSHCRECPLWVNFARITMSALRPVSLEKSP